MAVRLGPDTNVDAGKPTRNQEFQARYNSLTDKQKDAYSKKWLGGVGKSAAFLGEAASYQIPIPVAQSLKLLKHMPDPSKILSPISKWIKNLGRGKAAAQTSKDPLIDAMRKRWPKGAPNIKELQKTATNLLLLYTIEQQIDAKRVRNTTIT